MRHVSRMFVVGAALRVPFFAVVLRKGYGLGAMAMTAGGFHAANFTIAWPTGEFGAMGLEGAESLLLVGAFAVRWTGALQPARAVTATARAASAAMGLIFIGLSPGTSSSTIPTASRGPHAR